MVLICFGIYNRIFEVGILQNPNKNPCKLLKGYVAKLPTHIVILPTIISLLLVICRNTVELG